MKQDAIKAAIENGRFVFRAIDWLEVSHANYTPSIGDIRIDDVRTVTVPKGTIFELHNARPEFAELTHGGRFVVVAGFDQLEGKIEEVA